MAHDKEKYEEFRRAVWERDYGIFIKDRKLKKGKDEWKSVCVFWKCLTNEERKQFLETHKENLWMCNTIDVAHLIPKSIRAKDKYNKENGALVNTLAHSALDSYRCPLTNKPMKRADKYMWMEKIRMKVMENASYHQEKGDKVNEQ